jgi:outer membrane lipoprotein SlyB
MRLINKITLLLLLLVLSSCATLPTGPSVNVLPTKGKPFDTFRTEDATCRQWAEQQVGKSTQETYNQNIATGAVTGTAVGAGVGAAIGSASGHAGGGALVGAASGLLLGSAVGSDSGRVYGREAQRRYDNAYVQCMYSYGNQVPGYRPRVVAAPPRQQVFVAPTPPPPAVAQDSLAQPPDFYVAEPPQFMYSPELNAYIAVGVPYDLVYTGSEYFYLYAGNWYRGPYYNGPWVYVPKRAYPHAFLEFKIDKIRHYRDLEFRRYERDREHYNGRIHRPEYRERGRIMEHREEHR